MPKLIRNSLFLSFYILALRLIFVELLFIEFFPAFIIGLFILLFSFVSRRNTLKTLYLFFALIPLLHGLRMLAILPNLPIIDLCFAGIFIAWLPKYYLTHARKIYQPTISEYLVDWLGLVIIISLLTVLSQYPLAVSWHALITPDITGITGRFWSIKAALVFLQGLIIFRIYLIESKSTKIDINKWFLLALYIQLFFILCFALIQIVSGLPETRVLISQGTINSPFDDRHSFGSTLILYFFILSGTLQTYKKTIYRFFLPLIGMTCIVSLIIKSGSVATLAALFFCLTIYLARRLNWKIAMFFILIISSSLVYYNLNPELLNKISHPTLHRVARRLLIKNVPNILGGRFENADQALGIISTYPISGIGIGSFYRVARYYHFSDQAHPKQIENAHNYYLQLASEAGLPALLIFLSILVVFFIAGLKKTLSIKGQSSPGNLRTSFLLGIMAYLITMLTGHPLILPVQQFCFWVVLAHAYTLMRPEKELTSFSHHYIFKLTPAILFLALLIGGARNKNKKFIDSPAFGYGEFHIEKWGNDSVRWTGKYFATKVNATSNILDFSFFTVEKNQDPKKGLGVRLFVNDIEIDHQHFFNSGWKQILYHIPKIKGSAIIIKTELSQTFNPYKLGQSQDHRDLGIVVKPINFLHIIPEKGFGFYDWEKLSPPPFPEFQKLKTVDGRWMGRQASLNLTKMSDSGLKIYYKCSHPDIKLNPVILDIFSDKKSFATISCKDYIWHQIEFDHEQLADSKILTLRLNRTWNPKSAVISEDSRNLGMLIITSSK